MLLSQQHLSARPTDILSFSTPPEDILQQYIAHPHLTWVGSGREALRQILLHCGKKMIGIPAYTCHVVLDAVLRAGCTPLFYDSGVVAEVEDIQQVIETIDVLVLCYNFGFLPDIVAIRKLCRKHNVILVEDCAQALGATVEGKPVGSFGDYAFYSLGISKNIGFCGGLIGSKEKWPKLLIEALPPYPFTSLLALTLKVLLAPLFFNPWIYPFTSLLLKRELKKDQAPQSWRMPPFARKIVLRQAQRYASLLQQRTDNGKYCRRDLKADYYCPTFGEASWLYAVVYGDDAFQQAVQAQGVELGRMLTFRCLDGKSLKALETEKKVLTFALARSLTKVQQMVSAINMVAHGHS